MTRHSLAAAVLLACAFALVTPTVASTSAQSADYPLELGNWWLYKGTIRIGPVTVFDECGGAHVYSQDGGPLSCEFEVRVEVTRVRPVRDGIRVVMLQKTAKPQRECPHPQAIFGDWFMPEQTCACLVTETGYYRLGTELAAQLCDPDGASEDVLKRMHHTLKEVGPSFVFPLHDGQRFAGDAGRGRTDGDYQWLVHRGGPETIAGRRYADVFVLRFLSLADDLTVHLVPGVGVTRRAYRHHGTITEWDLRLAEFRVQ
jgi:hypothetical protein